MSVGWWAGLVGLVATLSAQPRTCTLVALGDVQLGRGTSRAIARHGAVGMWAGIDDLLADADLRVANLECPVTCVGRPVDKKYCFRADPSRAKAVLRAGGIDVVSLANNHTQDWGPRGLAETRRWLNAWGITTAGAGQGEVAAAGVRVRVVRGLRVGFVGYSEWVMQPAQPGPAHAHLARLNEATLAAEIAAAKARVDCLVVSLHWGQEYQARPSARQQRLGRAAIDAGADLVLGHHPHVAQPIETYRGKPIVYSLGNAIFDREGSARWSNGLVVRLELGRDRARVVDKKGIWTRAGRPVRR